MAPWVSACVVIGAVSQAAPVNDTFEQLKAGVTGSEVFQQKVATVCAKIQTENCHNKALDSLFCQLLKRSKPVMAAAHCGVPTTTTTSTSSTTSKLVQQKGTVTNQDGLPKLTGALAQMKARIMKSKDFQAESERMAVVLGCNGVKKTNDCDSYVQQAAFCLAFTDQMNKFGSMDGVKEETKSMGCALPPTLQGLGCIVIFGFWPLVHEQHLENEDFQVSRRISTLGRVDF